MLKEHKATRKKMVLVFYGLLLTGLIVMTQSQILSYGNGSVHAGFEVHCTDNQIRVYFDLLKIEERSISGQSHRNYVISWKGQTAKHCVIDKENSTNILQMSQVTQYHKAIYVKANFSSECGLQEIQTPDYIKYNQTVVITYGENPSGGLIRREEYDYYHVSCIRNRTVQQKLKGEYFNATFREQGKDEKNTSIKFNMVLVHSNMLGRRLIEYKLGDLIKFELNFTSAATSNLKAVIQNCWTTSNGISKKYSLINNRCPTDHGTKFLQKGQLTSSWKTEAFRYLSEPSSRVYVECEVRVCKSSDISGPCSYPQCKYTPLRKRREVSTEPSITSNEMSVIKSPVFFIVDKDEPIDVSPASTSSPVGGTNGTIIIVLLSVLIFIIGVVVIKKIFFSKVLALPTAPTVSMKGVNNEGLA